MWTENCAGKTASYNTLFRKSTEYALRGVDSPYAASARELNSWKIAISRESLAAQCGLTNISEMELFADPWSHKVYAVRLSDGKSSQTRDFFALQEFVGKERLRSAEFSVSLEKENIVFTGYGEGHGVGLCLYSAEQLAERGRSAAEILAHFYPDATLRRDLPVQKIAVRRSGPMQPCPPK
jgi:stage II sporulation protein D